MFFNSWVTDSTGALAAVAPQDLLRQSVSTFRGAVTAIAKAVDGLSAGTALSDYRDFMNPWVINVNGEVETPAEIRNPAIPVISGCALCVEAVWRCLGIGGDELHRRYGGYNPSKGFFGAMSEIEVIAKRAVLTGPVPQFRRAQQPAVKGIGEGAHFTPQQLVSGKVALLMFGDVVVAEDPEHAFMLVDEPIPVDRDGETVYSVKCLHGGQKTLDSKLSPTGKQTLLCRDTELTLSKDSLYYEDPYGQRRLVSAILRTALIPRTMTALLPPGWDSEIPSTPEEPEPEAPPEMKQPQEASGLALSMLLQAKQNGPLPPGAKPLFGALGFQAVGGGDAVVPFQGMWKGHDGRG